MYTVGFSTQTKNLLSRLIRWFSKSQFSHAWVRYYHPLYEKDIVVDADAVGIIEKPYHLYVPNLDNVVELVPPEGFNAQEGIKALADTLGTQYDYASIIGRLWYYLTKKLSRQFKWMKLKVFNPFANHKLDVCVENQLRFLQAGGVLKDVNPEIESPQSVYDRLIALGWKKL